MARKALEKIDGERMTFVGTFARKGTKPAYTGGEEITILIKSIRCADESRVVTDHLWFNYTKGFKALEPIAEGDLIQFDARVKEYIKGYKGYKVSAQIGNLVSRDWKLSHPTRISKVEA